MPALASFLSALFTNRSSDLFVARLGTKLLLAKFGITGFLADVLGWFVRKVIGILVDEGIYIIDLTLDSIKAAMSIEEFRKTAIKEYARARRKGLTDAEKAQIRREYLDTLDKFTRLSNAAHP